MRNLPPLFSAITAVSLLLMGTGCESNGRSVSAGTKRPATTTIPVAVPENRYSAIAEREIVRRKARIQAADQAATRAASASASGNDEAALEEYSRALDTLPATR